MALGVDIEQDDADDEKLHSKAISKWNERHNGKALTEARKLIERLEVTTRRTASFSTLNAELKHWLKMFRGSHG